MRKSRLNWTATIFLLALWARAVSGLAQGDFKEVKGNHFVVFYNEGVGTETAQTVLRRAEGYYDKIGDQIGYTRYNKFWTWDERAKIIIFATQASFLANTGMPAWSTGYANRDSQLFKSKVIMTYQQEADFYDGLLPHEISHLIMHDFAPKERVPIWFDEGVAQLWEADKSDVARTLMRILVEKNKYIDFSVLMGWDIREEKDPNKVKIFYAQSLSVVEFLIKQYGNEAFGRLCRYLHDGKSFDEAIHLTYPGVDSFKDLQGKWASYSRTGN